MQRVHADSWLQDEFAELHCAVRVVLAGVIHPRLAVTLCRAALELREAELGDVCTSFILANTAAVVAVEPIAPAVSGPLLDAVAKGLSLK